MRRQLGLGVLWGVLLALASVPLWLKMPAPDSGAVNHVLRWEDGDWKPVTLPQARRPSGRWEHYRLVFQGEENAAPNLFIPTVSQRAIIELAGEEVADTQHRTTLMGMASGVAALVPLPRGLLSSGDNVIDIHVQSLSLVPAYLSTVYVGSADELSYYYRAQVFLLEYLRLMIPAGQLLIALVVAVLWLYRPREALFGWLFLLLTTSMYLYLGMMRDLVPQLLAMMPYLHMLGSSAAAIQVIIVLLIAGVPTTLAETGGGTGAGGVCRGGAQRCGSGSPAGEAGERAAQYPGAAGQPGDHRPGRRDPTTGRSLAIAAAVAAGGACGLA